MYVNSSEVCLIHKQSKMIKTCPMGFSWTSLFFGVFVPVFRQWWSMTLIQLGLALVTFGVSWLVFPFIMNKMWIESLLKTGFAPKSEEDVQKLNQIGIMFSPSYGDA